MNEHRELLSRWLRMLFYVQIAALVITAVNILTNLDSITSWISKALSVVVIWAMFRVKDINPRYQNAAISRIVVLICTLITRPVNSSALGLSSILMLVGATASWVASYQEYHAHGEVVAEQDEKLAKKWNSLFVWEIVGGLSVSLLTTVATLVLVSAGMDSAAITTIALVMTNLVNILLEALYLLYMTQTLKLIENGD